MELYHNMNLLYVYVFIVHFVLIKISFAKTAIDISFHLFSDIVVTGIITVMFFPLSSIYLAFNHLNKIKAIF